MTNFISDKRQKKQLSTPERQARLTAALDSQGAIQSILSQSAGTEGAQIARWVVRTPATGRINVDVTTFKNGEITVSLSNADLWCRSHDTILQPFGKVIAQAIVDSGAQVKFKQPQLQKIGGAKK